MDSYLDSLLFPLHFVLVFLVFFLFIFIFILVSSVSPHFTARITTHTRQRALPYPPPSQRANRLIALPPELGNMQQLKELLVAENPLGTIPLGIDRNSTVELKNYLCVVTLLFERPTAIVKRFAEFWFRSCELAS